MRRHKRRELEVVSNMNLTSLLDVTFILLVCFMMVAPSLNSGLQLELTPIDEKAKALNTSNKPVMISIQNRTQKEREPMITVDTKRLDYKDLKKHLQDRRAGNPKLDVIIACDKREQSEVLLKVIGTVQAAGIESVGLETDVSPDRP